MEIIIAKLSIDYEKYLKIDKKNFRPLDIKINYGDKIVEYVNLGKLLIPIYLNSKVLKYKTETEPVSCQH